jgi:hypothetical protein
MSNVLGSFSVERRPRDLSLRPIEKAAQYQLGMYYLNGRGVKADPKKGGHVAQKGRSTGKSSIGLDRE